MLMLSPSCFDLAQHKIYMLMAKDCYPRFLRSPAYRDLVCQATTSAKATGQEKKAWNLGASCQRIVSGHLKCWEGKNSVLHQEASSGCRHRNRCSSSWTFCRRRQFEDWREKEKVDALSGLLCEYRRRLDSKVNWKCYTEWQSNRRAGEVGKALMFCGCDVQCPSVEVLQCLWTGM